MERLTLENVPVRLDATVSPEHYRRVEAEAKQRLDLKGMLKGMLVHGEAWANAEWTRMEGAKALGDIRARALLEGGKVGLRAAGIVAEVGHPLKTVRLKLEDGKVTAIEGGGRG